MSSGRQAVHDDEVDWENTKKSLNIAEVTWDVYSQEADTAVTLHNMYGLTGQLLILGVKAIQDIVELKRSIRSKEQLIEQYAEMQKQLTI